ncbi:MAG: hypothetical protein ACYC0X_23455 [Pirellulaceae bacterium]
MSTAPKCIDDHFVETWHPKYDETEQDEPEYERIVRNVECDTQTTGTVSEQTFRDILDWKWAGLKGKIRWENIQVYLDAIRKCLADPDDEKMRTLDDMPIIGPPVASTILHFLHPSSFPIFDVRTVAVLRHFGCIQHKSTGFNQYAAFRHAVLSLQQSLPKWSLRQIDKAMFAYHKCELAPKALPEKRRTCRKCKEVS